MFQKSIRSKSIRLCIYTNRRKFQVTVVGAAGGIGQPLSMLLKSHPLITRLVLYDKNKMTPGVAKDLSHIPTSAHVNGCVGEENLNKALSKSDIVVIPGGQPRKPGMAREDLFSANANVIVETLKAVAPICPKAFIAIITNPVNSLMPLACKILEKHSALDPRRIFGVTTLDAIRAKTFYSQILKVNPNTVDVPIICGHSDSTIIPVFSAATPKPKIEQNTIAEMTDRIRKAGTEVVKAKAGGGSATLSMAFAGHMFVDCLLQALNGATVTHSTFVINNDFGTKYFAGPVQINKEGAVEMKRLSKMSKFETDLLEKAIKVLRKDIEKGETFAK